MTAEVFPRELTAGQVVAGKYRVERVIAAGGQGTVVEATHLRLKQSVAIKFPHLAGDDIVGPVERMFREARSAFRLRGEHVARIIDVDVVGGAPFIVMEYLHGVDLKNYLAQRGALPIDEAVGLMLQACEALAEAHDQGIIHRDLKPSNLFLVDRSDGAKMLKILDFGLSKAETVDPAIDISDLTEPERMLGSPRYMSPEQVRDSHDVDARSDVWSLGVVLQELLTGAPMFRARTNVEALALVLARSPAPISLLRPEVPPEIERVVLRCLQKFREHRFASVRELAEALAPYAPVWAVGSVERLVPGAVRRRSEDAGEADLRAGDASASAAAAPRAQVRRRRAGALALAGGALLAGGLLWGLARVRPPVLGGLAGASPGVPPAESSPPRMVVEFLPGAPAAIPPQQPERPPSVQAGGAAGPQIAVPASSSDLARPQVSARMSGRSRAAAPSGPVLRRHAHRNSATAPARRAPAAATDTGQGLDASASPAPPPEPSEDLGPLEGRK